MTSAHETDVLTQGITSLVETKVLCPPARLAAVENAAEKLTSNGDVLVQFFRFWFSLHGGSERFLASHFRVLSGDEALAQFDQFQRWPIGQVTELDLHYRRVFPLMKAEFRDTDIGVVWDEVSTFRIDLPIVLISGDSRLIEVLDCNLAGLVRYVDDRAGWERAWAAIPHMLNPRLSSEQWSEN